MRVPITLLALALALAAAPAAAQDQATPLAVGTEAPEFSLPSATSRGVGKTISLSDFHGQTVVIAFFYRARSSG
jgi:cytochrome oxidase Cu insertion factor (SCO1/SenC/PrrC family)